MNDSFNVLFLVDGSAQVKIHVHSQFNNHNNKNKTSKANRMKGETPLGCLALKLDLNHYKPAS